jgi:hypothetical protein
MTPLTARWWFHDLAAAELGDARPKHDSCRTRDARAPDCVGARDANRSTCYAAATWVHLETTAFVARAERCDTCFAGVCAS